MQENNQPGAVMPTQDLRNSAVKAARDAREASVRWDQAPSWAAVYAVQKKFGTTVAKWWAAIGHMDSEGASDESTNKLAPIYFDLLDDEPIKLFHRPDLKTQAMDRVGEVPVESLGRPGENPMVGKVSGYRVLTQKELDLVNDIKAVGPLIESLLERARTVRPVTDADDARLIALGRTNFQQAAFWLIRAVAKPGGFF